MDNFKITITKEEEPEDVKGNPDNPVLVERDRGKRETEWELVNEILGSAKKRYLDGKEPLAQSLVNTIQALADEYRALRDKESKPYRGDMEEDIQERREEEKNKPF